MADFFKFTWRCIKHAWRGCWTKANELASVLGGAILFAILFFLRNWLRTMNLINAPTTLWGTAGFAVALAIASVILAFLVIFLGRLVLAPTRLYWEQHRRADSLETDLLAMKANPDDGPNWSIHELFTHADPNFLSRTDEGVGDRWDEVGNDIRDQAALGRLRIWGRTMPRGVDSVLGQRTTLQLIEPSYWTTAFLTYSFFDDTAGDVPHTYLEVGRNGVEYTDLQVNRAEVLKLWPGEPDDLAESYANIRVANSSAVIVLFNGRERTKLIGLLSSNKLTTWSRLSASTGSDLVPVEGKIWNTHKFMFIPKDEGPGTINQTYLRPRGTYNSTHYDVCLNYAQLKRAWPHLQIRRTACDIR